MRSIQQAGQDLEEWSTEEKLHEKYLQVQRHSSATLRIGDLGNTGHIPTQVSTEDTENILANESGQRRGQGTS